MHLSVVQLPVDVDLALGDVAGEVRDRVRDVCDESGRESGYGSKTVPRGDSPSLGMVRMGICVMEPRRPCTRPARS